MLPQERRWVLARTELGCAGLHKTYGLGFLPLARD